MYMKDAFTKFGAVALALAMSGLPAIAFAQGGDQTQGNDVQVTSVQAEQVQQSGSAEGQQKQGTQVSHEGQKNQLEASSSGSISSEENVEATTTEVGEQEGLHLGLESDANPATSLEDLKQKIEARKQQLKQEVASTTEADKNIVENANPMRLAVHALLASKDLVGGIGAQVSEIAKQMNDSVATTTNAEAKIQSRGFITRLLFGGDTTSADVIAKEAAQNQTRIDSLTALLGQANVSADVQATLTEQITALKDAQARLEALAAKEKSAWGLFSWRF
jgi:hypothetical protein